MLSCFSPVRLFRTPWTATCQAPLSTGFSRQEHWSGLPCPSPGDLPGPGIKLESLTSNLQWQVGSLPVVAQKKLKEHCKELESNKIKKKEKKRDTSKNCDSFSKLFLLFGTPEYTQATHLSLSYNLAWYQGISACIKQHLVSADRADIVLGLWGPAKRQKVN